MDSLPQQYTCTYCQEVFDNLASVQQHLETHSPAYQNNNNSAMNSQAILYACPICHQRFYDFNSGMQHMITHAPTYQNNNNSAMNSQPPHFLANIPGSSNPRRNPDNCKCRFVAANGQPCNQQCTSQAELKTHVQAHQQQHTNKKICEYCGFDPKDNYNRHRKTHIPEQQFECYRCGKSSNDAYDITKHAFSQHPGLKPWKCKCDGEFDQWMGLKKHIKNNNYTPAHIPMKHATFKNMSQQQQSLSSSNNQMGHGPPQDVSQQQHLPDPYCQSGSNSGVLNSNQGYHRCNYCYAIFASYNDCVNHVQYYHGVVVTQF